MYRGSVITLLRLKVTCTLLCQTPPSSHQGSHNDSTAKTDPRDFSRVFNSPRTFQAFNKKDEEELVRVISAKPRHVLKHVRQLVWRSRKRELHFRNTVTQLMIVLQDFLRKEQIDPQQASSIMEGILEECVKLLQHDMAHLLFRAFLRFRKYGCTISIDALRHLFSSYEGTDSTEFMNQLATEMAYDYDLRPFCVAAYLFSGNIEEAEKLLAAVPITEMTPLDIVAIVEGYDKLEMRDKSFEILQSLTALKCRGEDLIPIYRSVFRICLNRKDFEGLESALMLCAEQDVKLDTGIFNNILRLKMRNASSLDEIASIEADLRQKGYEPDITGNSIIISACARINHYGDQGGDEIMLQKVNTLLNSIEARLKERDADIDITGAHLRAIIRGYGAAGKADLLKKAWPRLQAKGISDSPRVYNELLKWYSLMGNVKDVLATKEEMEAERIYCDSLTYSWVLRALGKWYPRHVERLYAEIRDRRIRIDIPLYTTLVGVFGDLGQFDIVEELEKEVKEKENGGLLQTNALYYAVLIRVHKGSLGKIEELEVISREKGFLDHSHVVTGLINAYTNVPTVDGDRKCQALLDSIPQWSTDIYNVLINRYGRENNVNRVKQLLIKMRDEEVEMNDVTFGTLVTTFGRLNDTRKVRDIIQLLKDKGGTVSSHFYSVLANSLSRQGDIQGVNDAWDDLIASKLAPDTEVYNSFLTLYGKHHNAVKMQSVMETMMRQVPPNPITATTVLDMLGKSGRITEMEALFEDMKQSPDAQPTAVTYHQVLNAYAKTADIDKMEALHEEMLQQNIPENLITFNILADGYGRGKRFEHLEDLLKRREEKGFPMDELGYCILVTTYGKVRGVTEVKRLAEALKEEYSHLLTRKVCWTLIDAFCRCREHVLMKEWATRIIKMAEEEDRAASTGLSKASVLKKTSSSASLSTTTTTSDSDSDEGVVPQADGSTLTDSTSVPIADDSDTTKEDTSEKSDNNNNNNNSNNNNSQTTEDSNTNTNTQVSGGPITDSVRMSLISYYCRSQQMDHVDSIIDTIENNKGELSYSALNAVAKGYACAGQFDKCVGVLHKIRDRDLVPDSSTCLSLSSMFLKAGLHEQAQQIVQWRRQYARATEEYASEE